MKNYNIALIPGDGIGPEIIHEGVKVLDAAARLEDVSLQYTQFPWGSDYYLETGTVVPESGFEQLKKYDSIYFGAAGDPRISPGIIEHQLILAMRTELDQYVNLRPVKLLPNVHSPIEGAKNVEIYMVRENTEDFYIRTGAKYDEVQTTNHYSAKVKRGIYQVNFEVASLYSGEGQYAFNLGLVTEKGTERVARYTFELARKKGKNKVTIITKRNAVPQMYSVWEDVFFEIAKDYPEIQAEKVNVDAAAMYLTKNPENFQVILAPNLFGARMT